MIRNILLGYNGTRGADVAFSQAADIAHAAKARIHVARIERMPADARIQLSGDTLADSSPSPTFSELNGATETVAEPSGVLDQVLDKCRREQVFCTFREYYGDPAGRLMELSRLAELLVVARRDEPRHSRAHPLGRVARQLAMRTSTPVLFTGHEHLPVKSAALLYEPRIAGGHALTMAGGLCSTLNITLNVLCVGHGETDAAQAEAEAKFALRAWHVEGEFVRSTVPALEAIRNIALTHSDPLIIVPAPPRRLFPAHSELVHAAAELPNTNLLLVP
ncbi:MAG: universal stress protein [Armatimonadia bacterium]